MENWIVVLIAIVALLIGGAVGYALVPEKQCEVKTCDPCIQQPCIQEPCFQEPCIQKPCSSTVEESDCECNCENTCSTNTPNEQIIEDNELTEEETKHARVQTVFLTCEEWEDREIEVDRLEGDCWKDKRKIVDLVPIRNGNQCKILSISGC